MNMKFFAVASDSEYEWLKTEADNLSDRNAYIFDNVEVENCVPDRITVGVFKKGGLYGMYVDPKPVYSGDSNFLQRLFDQRVVLFGSWDKLKDDCRSIEHRIMNNNPSITNYRYEGNIQEATNLIDGASLIFGSRFHASILSINYGIPLIPFAYSKKTTNLLRFVHYEGDILDIHNLDEAKIDSVIKNAKKSLKSIDIDSIKKQAEKHFIELDKVLK